MKTRTILLIVASVAAISIGYMCWIKKREFLSGLGLGTGMLNYGIGPSNTYEGFTLDADPSKNLEKQGNCGVCS